MIQRCKAINFQDFNDYDYSEGETSEDLFLSTTKSRNSTGENKKTESRLTTMKNHLQNVNQEIGNGDISRDFIPFFGEKFSLEDEQKHTCHHAVIDPIECVILQYAHPRSYPRIHSEFQDNLSQYIAWGKIDDVGSTEFCSHISSFYKSKYVSFRNAKQIRSLHLLSPNIEKMNSLALIRRDIPIGRILYHYVGFGYPTINQDVMFLVESHAQPKPYPLSRIFESIQPPSCFIFDCNNSHSALLAIHTRAKELSESQPFIPTTGCRTYAFQREKSWNDWFFFGTTEFNEKIPDDPLLPRDFLTSCILTPIPTAILCHILRYYRTSFPQSSLPYDYLNSKLLFNGSEQSKRLTEILTAIIDAIASDYLSSSLFTSLFRKDATISILFRHFLLAQYLLNPYDVHPVSNPVIPDMHLSPLWSEWSSIVDTWISNTLTPMPDFSRNFFSTAVTTFATSLKSKPKAIPNSLLVIIGRVPFEDIARYSHLANYASKSPENRERLGRSIVFNEIFSKILQHSTIDADEYHAICYIILSLLQKYPCYTCDCRCDQDMRILPDLLFNTSLHESTRTIIAAIVSALVTSNTQIEYTCSKSAFLHQIKEFIPKSSSTFILWLLLVIKKTFENSIIPFSLFYQDSLHVQIGLCLTHSSSKVRAAAVSVLSSFMQPKQDELNIALLLMAAPLFCDISFFVRHELLLLFVSFLKLYNDVHCTRQPIMSVTQFSTLFSMWIGEKVSLTTSKFTDFVDSIDSIISKNSGIDHMRSYSHFMIEYFCYDPHPGIRNAALKARVAFAKNEHDMSFEDNSLFKDCLREIVESGRFTFKNKAPPRSPSCGSHNYGQISIPTATVSNRRDIKENIKVAAVASHPTTKCFAVADNTSVFFFNQNYELKSRLEMTTIEQGKVTDLHVTESQAGTMVVAATDDGCVTLWNPSQSDPVAVFRSDSMISAERKPNRLALQIGCEYLVSGRGTALNVWNLVDQKMEDEIETKSDITAIEYCSGESSIVLFGEKSGVITGYNTSTKNVVFTVSLQDEVVKIAGNRAGADLMYMAAANGRCVVWNSTDYSINPVVNRDCKITHFDAHFALPLQIYSSNEEPPVVMSGETVLTVMKQVENGATPVFHPILPIVYFVTPSGQLSVFEIALSP